MNISPAEKRIFITGGTGFIGKSILSMLRRGLIAGGEFTVLSRDPEKFVREHPALAGLKNVRFTAGDVRNFTFPDENFDLLIHAAAPARNDLPTGEMRSIILDGVRRVLEFASRHGVKKMLFVSSGAVYGPVPPELERIPENWPPQPADEYGTAKLEAEKLCVESGVPVSIARCFAFVGPHLDRNIHFAVGNFIRDAIAGKSIVVNGDGSPVRSYLYADDLVRWLFAILLNGRPGIAYNVGGDRPVSILELAETVRRILNTSVAVTTLNRSAAGRNFYVPSVERAENELGLSVTVDLAEAIRRSAANPGE